MKNLIFDLGNVLVKWDPYRIIENVLKRPADESLVQLFFGHPDWFDVDRGLKVFADIIGPCTERTNLPREIVEQIYYSVPSSLSIIPDGIDILHSIKNAGYRVYALTNMGIECAQYLSNTYDFWLEFDGIIVSGEVQSIKPEKKIFDLLLVTYGLNKNESIFIDDSLENVQFARSLGIQSIQVVEHKIVKQQLKKYFNIPG